MRFYSIACTQGTSAQELVLNVPARSYRDAIETVKRWGYVPVNYN